MGRAMIAGALGLALAGGGAAWAGGPAMTGFHDLAARGELIEVRKPLWQDGKLRVGTATGRVKRRAVADERGSGAFGVEYREVERSGRSSFTVTGAEVRGTLSGECTYGREERRVEGGGWTAADPVGPLRLRCDFARDGRAIGHLRLGAVPQPMALVQRTVRTGEVEVGGTRLALRSAHRMGADGVKVATPVGYFLDDANGDPVAAVDTNGITRVRLALPRDPAQRDAALAAGVALAIFWDPGDTDD